MAVSSELEILIRRLEKFNSIFNVIRNNDVLEFFVHQEKLNPWFEINDIIFDCDATSCFINYTLNGNRYSCFSETNGVNNTVEFLTFLDGVANLYTEGRGFLLMSQNQQTIKFAGINISFKELDS